MVGSLTKDVSTAEKLQGEVDDNKLPDLTVAVIVIGVCTAVLVIAVIAIVLVLIKMRKNNDFVHLIKSLEG